MKKFRIRMANSERKMAAILGFLTIRKPNAIPIPNDIDHPNSERVRYSSPHCIANEILMY